MGYEEFKETLLKGLREFYGEDAEVGMYRMLGINGQGYDGLWIAMAGDDGYAGLVARLEDLYEEHGDDGADGLDACMEAAINAGEQYICSEEAERFIGRLEAWESMEGMVRPVLVNAVWNRGLLDGLASMTVLDLAVVYTIQDGEAYRMMVSDGMLKHYGVGLQELHRQAMENMRQDGYRFLTTMEAVKDRNGGGAWKGMDGAVEQQEVYVLTNQAMEHGAAGLLQGRLLQEFASGRSFYILPASIDVAIFLPEDSSWDVEMLDRMVQAVNQEVGLGARLSDHSYYYDGEKDEIRMAK